jgi:hypothetical protein
MTFSVKRGITGKFVLCASCSVSGSCVRWINIDPNHKMAIIRMDGNFGKAGGHRMAVCETCHFALRRLCSPSIDTESYVKVGRVCSGRADAALVFATWRTRYPGASCG